MDKECEVCEELRVGGTNPYHGISPNGSREYEWVFV